MTAPLTPADCDLRDYPWMPLDCTRLLTSETWMLGTAEEKVAALTLWCKSWHQVPAGSLPNNDKMLASLSESGPRWSRVRDHAMRGWILCDDGRLYHPVVSEKANHSWGLKQKQKARTQAARQALDAKRRSVTDAVTETVTGVVAEIVTGSIRTEQNRTEKKVSSNEVAPRAASPQRSDRGSRLPPDWAPTDADIAYAEKHGVDWQRASERFRNYWVAKAGKAGVMRDWAATWRNWVLRDADQPKPKLHTLPPAEQDRRILAAVGLGFNDPPPIVQPIRRIAT